MRWIVFGFFFFITTWTHVKAQDTIIMPVSGNGGFYNSCYAVIFDNGSDSNYFNFSNSTVTIAPLWVENISLYFEEFETETFFDSLTIYDGPGTSFARIGTYSGTELLGQTIYSSGNSITLGFISDDIQTHSGFKAWVACSMDAPLLNSSDLIIHPNPAIDLIKINGIETDLIADIYLTNLVGSIIKISVSNEINISELPSGIYSMNIFLKNGNKYIKKLMKI